MDLKQKFGKKIKQLRDSVLMTQEQFAENIDMNRTTLARIESGTNFVTSETIENIQQFLNIDYKDLFDFDKSEKKDYKKAFLVRMSQLNEKDLEFFIKTIDTYLQIKK